MAKIKFMTAKGSDSISTTPFYIGVPQHERTMSKKESYEFFAEKTGYSATSIRGAFLALREYLGENAKKANITYCDGIASVRPFCKGAFAGLTGPWVKGKNYIQINAIALDPFKSILSDLTPTNQTEGAKPSISTVLDTVTGVYDVITGTNVFATAGVDLGPDVTKTDEYVAVVDKSGVETKCETTLSTLGMVKAKLNTALAAGEYTLKIYTRSGLGSEFGVKCATRKVVIA